MVCSVNLNQKFRLAWHWSLWSFWTDWAKLEMIIGCQENRFLDFGAIFLGGGFAFDRGGEVAYDDGGVVHE
jgi:hypothetical protein